MSIVPGEAVRCIDITRTLGLDEVIYPGDPPFSKRRIASIANGDAVNVTELTLGSHSGIHLDAPRHFLAGGPTLEDIPVGRFFLEVQVLEVEDSEAVRAAHVRGANLKPGEGILFRTKNRELPRDSFSDDYVYVTPEAARAVVELGAALVGLDYLSVERPGDIDFPVHRTLLGAGILILEDVNLGAVVPGSYTLVCLPLKWSGGDGAPCRAVLFPHVGQVGALRGSG